MLPESDHLEAQALVNRIARCRRCDKNDIHINNMAIFSYKPSYGGFTGVCKDCIQEEADMDALGKLPEGYTVLTKGAFAGRGDLWLRPTDNVWIETGSAHWGCQVVNDVQYARREHVVFDRNITQADIDATKRLVAEGKITDEP